MKDNNGNTYLMIKLSKTMTMADLQNIVNQHGCSFHQVTFKQPDNHIIPKPLKSRMVANVPRHIASSIDLTTKNDKPYS